MGLWNNYKEELDAAKLELAEARTLIKVLKKRAKKAEKALKTAQRPNPTNKPKAENVIQKLAESLDMGGGLTSASKLGSWRAAKTAEYRSQQNALTMGPIGSLDAESN